MKTKTSLKDSDHVEREKSSENFSNHRDFFGIVKKSLQNT